MIFFLSAIECHMQLKHLKTVIDLIRRFLLNPRSLESFQILSLTIEMVQTPGMRVPGTVMDYLKTLLIRHMHVSRMIKNTKLFFNVPQSFYMHMANILFCKYFICLQWMWGRGTQRLAVVASK